MGNRFINYVQLFCVAPFSFHLTDLMHFSATYMRISVHHFQCASHVHSSSLQSVSTVNFLNWHSLKFTPCALKFTGSDKCPVLLTHHPRTTQQHFTPPALVLIRLYILNLCFLFFLESLAISDIDYIIRQCLALFKNK